MDKLLAERHEAIRKARSAIVDTPALATIRQLLPMLPTQAELKTIATYVNLEKLREIDDPEVVTANFKKVEAALIVLASAIGVLNACLGEINHK